MKTVCFLLWLMAPVVVHATPLENAPAFTTRGAFFAVSVADLDASADWYARKLGMKVVMDLPKRGKTAIKVLEGGGLIVELIQNDDARALRSLVPASGDQVRVHGITKSGIVVEDWDRLLSVFKERGVEIYIGPFPPRTEQRANLIIKDNAGNMIQFFGKFAEPPAR